MNISKALAQLPTLAWICSISMLLIGVPSTCPKLWYTFIFTVQNLLYILQQVELVLCIHREVTWSMFFFLILRCHCFVVWICNLICCCIDSDAPYHHQTKLLSAEKLRHSAFLLTKNIIGIIMCLTLVTQYSSFNFFIFSHVAGPSFRLRKMLHGETSHFWIHVTEYFQNTRF